jgi:hypothetical protein
VETVYRLLDIDSIFTIIETTNNRAQDEPKHRHGQEVGGICFLPVFYAPEVGWHP